MGDIAFRFCPVLVGKFLILKDFLAIAEQDFAWGSFEVIGGSRTPVLGDVGLA